MTARANTSIRLSADERRRLLEWGPDVSAAVRRLLDVAENRETPPTTRELVRAKMRPGRTATDIARMLGLTRQAVQWHMKRIREGA
jgi:DNA-binding NarL/FixJ family response regulator